MRKLLLSMLTLILLAWPAPGASACSGELGTGPFTIVGWVQDGQGKPLGGLPLVLAPLAPGGEPDLENGVYRIDERDDHLVRTAADGMFVMPQVYDSPEVVTHRYLVLPADFGYGPHGPAGTGSGVWLEGGLVDLTGLEPDMVKLRLTARPAGTLRLELREGRPYTGARAVLLESSGLILAYTAHFAGGVHRLNAAPPGVLRVSLLDGELAGLVQEEARHLGQTLHDRLLIRDGQPLVAELVVTPGEEVSAAFALP